MDDDTETLVRNSLRHALSQSGEDISAALDEFDWHDLLITDEALAFTVLFEELGYLAADTTALDIAIATVLHLDGRTPVLWPVDPHASAQEMGGSGVVVVDGVCLRGQLTAPNNVLAPVCGRMQLLAVSSAEENRLGGMARGLAWVRRRVWGTPTTDFGPWVHIERRARLAIASELVGLTHRIVDLAVEQVGARQQFGRPIAANQAVRFRVAEAHVELVGAKALVAAAWQDQSVAKANWAKAVAGCAYDAVAKHAIQVCGAIGLSDEHPLPALVRRGMALDALLGSATQQERRIGHELIAHQKVPQTSGQAAALAVGWF